MNRVAVVVASLVIIAAGVAGCSHSKSPGSASTAGASGAGAGNPKGAVKVVVNGQQQNIHGPAVCKPLSNNFIEVSIAEQAPDDVYVQLMKDASKVAFVRIRNFNGMELDLQQAGAYTTEYGHAGATKGGNGYTVSGTISGTSGDKHPVFPFEIDFSCP